MNSNNKKCPWCEYVVIKDSWHKNGQECSKCGKDMCWLCGGKMIEYGFNFHLPNGHEKCKYCDRPQCDPC